MEFHHIKYQARKSLHHTTQRVTPTWPTCNPILFTQIIQPKYTWWPRRHILPDQLIWRHHTWYAWGMSQPIYQARPIWKHSILMWLWWEPLSHLKLVAMCRRNCPLLYSSMIIDTIKLTHPKSPVINLNHSNSRSQNCSVKIFKDIMRNNVYYFMIRMGKFIEYASLGLTTYLQYLLHILSTVFEANRPQQYLKY